MCVSEWVTVTKKKDIVFLPQLTLQGELRESFWELERQLTSNSEAKKVINDWDWELLADICHFSSAELQQKNERELFFQGGQIFVALRVCRYALMCLKAKKEKENFRLLLIPADFFSVRLTSKAKPSTKNVGFRSISAFSRFRAV